MVAPGVSVANEATLVEWLAQPESARFELIDGVLVPKAGPSLEHGLAQAGTVAALTGTFGRRASTDGLGGWWLGTEIDVVLDGRGYRPDLIGWRRDRVERPRERPVIVRPDWVGEVVSESNRAVDTVVKLARYHQAGVPHYWILDQVERTLTVHRHAPDGYLIALRAVIGERVRAEPFAAMELEVAVLLGEDSADAPG